MNLHLSVIPKLSGTYEYFVVAFSYQLPATITNATIIISDMAGKVIKEINIDEGQGQKLWDVRDVESGVYIYSIKTANISVRDKIIIQ